ncbi:MAG: hypothetical protein ACI4TF_13195 [Oliverpabstia sp.]
MDLKNQYFGDVGDYGKYGLLRFLVNNGISIAINWYLSPLVMTICWKKQYKTIEADSERSHRTL